MVSSVAENIAPSAYRAWQIYHSCMALLRSTAAGFAVDTAEIAAVVEKSDGS